MGTRACGDEETPDMLSVSGFSRTKRWKGTAGVSSEGDSSFPLVTRFATAGSPVSHDEEKETELVHPCELKMDAKVESAVEVVEAEMEDENENDVGRGANTVDILGSKVSELGSMA
jgi:hypothetical protein